MCNCVNIEPGSYDNTVVLVFPFPTVRFPDVGTKKVNIDRCIALEVIDLWNMGIETIESCCGHNKTQSFVAVPDKHIQSMLDMRYVQNHHDQIRKEIFRLKSA